MKEENVPVITDRDELYDKCENMEQLFSSYYLPLLEVHYRKTYDLQKENKSLQSQLKAKEEVIEEAREYVNFLAMTTQGIIEEMLDKCEMGLLKFNKTMWGEELLEILSKGENK